MILVNSVFGHSIECNEQPSDVGISFTETFRLGLTNLRLHKAAEPADGVGIILGVAAVIVMVAIGQGGKEAALQQIQKLGPRQHPAPIGQASRKQPGIRQDPARPRIRTEARRSETVAIAQGYRNDRPLATTDRTWSSATSRQRQRDRYHAATF